MYLSVFTEKFNKIEGNTYTVEEEVNLVNGVYIGYLQHDNVDKNTIAVYTGSKLTGSKITKYYLSSPTLAPWKWQIKVYSIDVEKAYITYTTIGDQVEAEDINNLQKEIIRTQEAVNTEENRAVNKEAEIENKVIEEIERATNTEEELATNLQNEINRATNKESEIDIELSNRYKKNETFSKEEVLQKIAELVDSAPETLDTLQELAEALGNDPNFATTITEMLANKVDKVEGKALSKNDYTNEEKQKVESAYNLRIPYILVDGENNVFTATVEGITEYKDGLPLCIKLPIDATDICTLNVNGLEGITILDSQNLKANIPYNIRYEITSNSFILQTKGGGGIDTSDATATSEDILINKSAYGPNGKIEGAMPINSGTNKVLALNETYNIPKGYQDGTSKVTQNIANNGALNGSIGVNGTFDIPAGYTSGGKVTQSIATQGAYTGAVSAVGYNPMYLRIPQGAYFTNTSAGYPEITIPRDWLISCLGVDANKIISGQCIADVWGNATIESLGGHRVSVGNVYLNGYSGALDVFVTTNFRPSFVYLRLGIKGFFMYNNGDNLSIKTNGNTQFSTNVGSISVADNGFNVRTKTNSYCETGTYSYIAVQ